MFRSSQEQIWYRVEIGGGIVVDGSNGELVWHRSRRCESGACFEAAADGAVVMIRNSAKPYENSLAFSHDAWRSFIAELKDGTSKQL